MNVSNEDEVYHLWDSSEELMCSETTPHPVNFEVYSVPETNQFYGLTYQGKIRILNFKYFFFNVSFFSGFAFESVNGAVGQQLLKCHVEICHADTENSVCETGCFDSETTTTTTTSTTTSTTTTSTTLGSGATPENCVNPSESQYCYTVPDRYDYYDYYDYNENYYHGDDAINVGATITISKKCHPEYELPGYYRQNHGYVCDYFRDGKYCDNWSVEFTVAHLVRTENGYISWLNCPQCGCTEDDIVTLDERENNVRGVGREREEFFALLGLERRS